MAPPPSLLCCVVGAFAALVCRFVVSRWSLSLRPVEALLEVTRTHESALEKDESLTNGVCGTVGGSGGG